MTAPTTTHTDVAKTKVPRGGMHPGHVIIATRLDYECQHVMAAELLTPAAARRLAMRLLTEADAADRGGG